MTDFNELLKQAKEMQEQMKKAQDEVLKIVVDGESGAGLVRVQMNGRHDVKSVFISDEVHKEEKAVLEDLIAAAFNDAVRKLEEKNKAAFSGMTAGLNLPPGFKFPF